MGIALTVFGVVHIALTPAFYDQSLRSIVDGGVAASVDADPDLVDIRSAGFWYVSAGLWVLILGVFVGWAERRIGSVPLFLGWLILGLAVWGIVLWPASGFWAVLLVALVAFHAARTGEA